MKHLFFLFVAIIFSFEISAQAPGDTIFVKAFKYGSSSRDSVINFPTGPLTYEKIIMKYNMRCKNALISTQSQPNQGCGEWDYSCNTYVVDSSKIENALNTAPSHLISNFTGTTFVYSNQTIYDRYNFIQTNVVLNNINSENQYTVGVGTSSVSNFLKASQKSGRSQILFTAAELIAAGYSAGNINGIILNVSNAGGGVNFFKLNIKHSLAPSLNSSTVAVSGFTNVFNSNYNFVGGNNRIQFYTPFVWDGTSNVLLDFSFTNTVPSNPIVFNGAITPSVTVLYANNNYALNLASYGQATINPAALITITNEITVSFWAYGDATQMPTNTSFIYGWANDPNQRNLNLHLPWSDNNMYFDCGNTANNFDRINKVSLAVDQGGQWNHWAFTKNAVTGNMKIYLNGVLWHSGTGMTRAITILNLLLGKDNALQNNWKGKVNELTIWNKELALTDIQTWMNKPYNNTHPFYTNLLAYYTMNEGGGLTLNDSKNNAISTGVNLQWTYDRGHKLVRTFFESTLRPNVVFVRGSYSITTNTVVVSDSIPRNPNVVQQYSVVSNNTVVPMTDDLLNLVSTQNLFEASPIKIYDGDLEVLTGTVAAVPQGTINITTLNYYKRYPFYNEIMSFVTPYGKGLDLGINGKSWFYDVSDLAPILKGKKRLVMALGGQTQEQMDIDFWFIVGTPPRTVIEFNQLWQGAARAGDASITSIVNDVRFNVLNVPISNSAQAFKMRSTITGHGAQGEFAANGGVIDHYLNFGGGPDEFTWNISLNCGNNPVYPQGGTWLYARQGWCPGLASLFKQFNVTPFVTPGTTVSIDYNNSGPQVGGGDYRYIVANQLVSYGGANHSLDASVVDVIAPGNKVFYSRTNPICASPLVLVQNTGSTNISSIDIDYWVNNSNVKQSFTWNGNLAFMDTATVMLPIAGVWQNGLQPNNNVFNVEIKKVNSAVDDYAFNNKYKSSFVLPAVISSSFTIEFKTNNYYTHNNYKILDENGTTIATSNFTAANTTFIDNYVLNGCYKLVVKDLGGDGLTWWANTNQGSGHIYIKDPGLNVLVAFQEDFGNGFEYSFTTDGPLSVKENQFGSLINLYPNPSSGKFTLEGNDIENSEIKITDLLGHVLKTVNVQNKTNQEFYTNGWSPGIYFVTIKKENQTLVKKIVVN